MHSPIRILHLDDNPLDAQLVAMTLEIEQGKMPSTVNCVQTRGEFLSALKAGGFNIILSDYRMPDFDGDQALKLAQEICPDIPFIMVTGELGEELVIETLKRGATDYVLKDRIFRLVPAIERALGEAENQARRREAEERLRESQRTLALAVEATRLGLFDYYPQTGALIWNDVAREHFGLSPGTEVSYELFLRGLHPADRKRTQLAVEHALSPAGSGDYHSEYRTIGLEDGKERWLSARGKAFFDANGVAVRFIGATTDISTVRQSQEEIRKAHAEVREILDSVQDPFYVLDREWRFTYINAKSEEFLRRGRTELLGKNLWDVFPQVLGSESEARLRQVMEKRVPMHFEIQSALAGVWVDVQTFPKADGGISVLYRDIGERKQQELALRLSEERFAAAFHMSPYPQAVSRVSDGVFIDVNAALLSLYGMSREEVIGKSSLEIGILADPAERSQLVALLQREGSVHGFEMHTNSRHQGERVVHLSSNLLRSSEEQTMLTVILDVTDRKRADRELVEAHEQLASTLDSITGGYFALDAHGCLLAANRLAEEHFACPLHELLGRNIWELSAEGRESALHARLQEASSLGRPVHFEARSPVRKDTWAEMHVYPRAKRFDIYFADITRRKQAETEVLRLLHESERQRQLLRAVIQHAPIGIGIMQGPEHLYIMDNPMFAPIVAGKGEIIGRTVREVFPEVAERVVPLLDEVYRTGIPFHATNVPFRLSRNGRMEDTFFTFIYAPWFNEGGSIEGVMSLAHETTEQVRVRNDFEMLNQDLRKRNLELEAERVKWQKLVEGIADEVWACDAGGEVSMVSFTHGAGARPIELEGEALDELIQAQEVLRVDGSLRPVEESPLQRSLKGEVVRGEELVRNKLTGETRIRQHSSVPVRDTDSVIIGAAAIVRDVTEARKAEAEIRRLNEELEERVRQRTSALERANQELESFSYSVSHDLKAPLRAIEGFARMLSDPRRSLPPEKQKEYLELIRTSTEQMATLIESLLAFARVSRQVPKLVPVDMRAVAEEALREQLRGLGESSARVRVILGDIPPLASGDPVLLRQVFANLLSNALKFTRGKEGPSVEISGFRAKDRLVYYVRDNGVGFPSRDADKLFQVFHRIHSSDQYEGTGIGLANVRKIVERHGGQVRAEGAEGVGATFYFELPIGRMADA
ncbi:MAG: aphA [Bacteroidetes bacterium]|nr:aphA [Bacteroidota bacterium]